MTLTTALKIMGMSAKALSKKYGSRAVGLSKRVKAGQVVSKAKKGGLSRYQPTKKQAKAEKSFRMKQERSARQKSDDAKAEYRDHFDKSGRRYD